MTGSAVYAFGDRYGPPASTADDASRVAGTGFRYGPPPWPGGRPHPSGTIVLAPDLPPPLAPRIQITLQRVLQRLDDELTPGRQSAAMVRAQFLVSPGRAFIDPLTGITVFLEGADQLVVGVPESVSALAVFDGSHFVDVPPEEWSLQLAGAAARLQALVGGRTAQPATMDGGGGVPWGLLLLAGVGVGGYLYLRQHRVELTAGGRERGLTVRSSR